MRIGAYQFDVTGDIQKNTKIICEAIKKAAEAGVRFLVFPECAMTGYPPRDIESSVQVDFEEAERAYSKVQASVDDYDIFVLLGTIYHEGNKYYNTAMLLEPHKRDIIYQKRALWGWDRDNFSGGNLPGIFEIEGLRIGVRICFEVRFPEYFRELYKENTDLNIVLFYDVTDVEDEGRYELIRSHVRTRAVENVAYTLSVNVTAPFQTAPTGLYDRSGRVLAELKPNEEALLIYDLDVKQPDFGEMGRAAISDYLLK